MQDQIAVASNATALGSMLGLALAEAGDGILVARPIYGRFELDYGLEADLRIVYADTDVNEGFEESVIDKFEKALRDFDLAHGATNRVRAVAISNPNNPTGRFFPLFFSSFGVCLLDEWHNSSDALVMLTLNQGNATPVRPCRLFSNSAASITCILSVMKSMR